MDNRASGSWHRIVTGAARRACAVVGLSAHGAHVASLHCTQADDGALHRPHIARHDARTRLQNGTLQIGALGKELVVQLGRTITRQTLTGVTTSPESIALSKDLRKRGWSFVGPTTMYAFMQAMGLVNDHLEGCNARARAAQAREVFEIPQ